MPTEGTDLDTQMDLVAQRVEFIELLRDDGAMETRDIVDALSHSRSTVTRALRELRGADLIEKTAAGYVSTLAGQMAAQQYRRYETASRAVLDSKGLLSALPESAAPPVDLLIDGDIRGADAAVPVRPLETITDRVQAADTARVYLPTLVNTHFLRAWHRAVVAEDVESEAVFDPELLTVLKGQYPDLLSEMAGSDGFSAFSVAGPPYAILLTERGDAATVFVVVYGDEATISGILVNETDAAVCWAESEFERLASEATDVTAALDSLRAAVGTAKTRAPSESERTPSGDDHGHAPHGLPVALKSEGFERLSEAYFDASYCESPAVSWRTGFTLTEVRAGHALDRRDSEGRNLTDRLVGRLRAGDNVVVHGPPGAGKSTICMTVACEWDDRDLGPVLYRERGSGDAIESIALLEAYLRNTAGHALVVVEDAMRDQATAIFSVMRALDGRQDVTFLLDARTQAWQSQDDTVLAARTEAYRRTAVEDVRVPKFDERECQRLVTHFSSLVGEDIDLTGAELHSLVEEGTRERTDRVTAGDAVVAQYHVTRRYDPAAKYDPGVPTALDGAVKRTVDDLADRETDVALDLAITACLLDAAGAPVALEYLYALRAADDFAELEAALEQIEGQLLFEPDRRTNTSEFRTRHEVWSIRFLEQVIQQLPLERARTRFGRCLTRVLSLADEPARRRRIEQHLGGRTPHLHRADAHPTDWADELVKRVFRLGQSASTLAPLYGETTASSVSVPQSCSSWIPVIQAYWRGRMNAIHGDLNRAQREFETFRRRCKTAAQVPPVSAIGGPGDWRSENRQEMDDADRRRYWEAVAVAELGVVARERGEFETAAERFEASLTTFRDIGDPSGEASVRKRLGNVAYKQGDLQTAHRHYQASADRYRELGDTHGDGTVRHNLGLIAYDRGDLDAAATNFEKSLAVYRDRGDRYSEATALRNRGVVSRDRGDVETATEYLEESLAVAQEIGDRHSEAAALRALGVTAHRDGDSETAREYLERALALFREIGDRQDEAHTRESLGTVALTDNELKTAVEHLEASLDICRNLGDRHGEATALRKLGAAARDRGDLSEARSHYADAADICLTNEFDDASEALRGVIDVCDKLGDEDALADWCQRAIDYARRTERSDLRRVIESHCEGADCE